MADHHHHLGFASVILRLKVFPELPLSQHWCGVPSGDPEPSAAVEVHQNLLQCCLFQPQIDECHSQSQLSAVVFQLLPTTLKHNRRSTHTFHQLLLSLPHHLRTHDMQTQTCRRRVRAVSSKTRSNLGRAPYFLSKPANMISSFPSYFSRNSSNRPT